MNPSNKLPKLSSILLEFYNDKHRKSIFRIFSELIYLSFVHKCLPYHYFSRYLFRKDRPNIRVFLPNKLLHATKLKVNDFKVAEVLENKLYFDLFYRQFNISLPKILMFNHRKTFVIDGKSFEISSPEAFGKTLENIILSKTSDQSVFIKSTYGTYGGDKIYKIYLQDVSSNPEMIKDLYYQVIKTGFLFQETLTQHPELCRLNPSCLNTIRFDTFIDKEGKIEVVSSYLRMSINNLHVDNIGSGGCCVSIDLESGKLRKEGYLIFRINGGKLLYEHPITKVQFEGFTIPDFDRAKELVLKVATYMPGLRLVGWDVAISPNGPVLIEGNSNYDLTGNDLCDGGYLINPVFRKVLKEINYIK